MSTPTPPSGGDEDHASHPDARPPAPASSVPPAETGAESVTPEYGPAAGAPSPSSGAGPAMLPGRGFTEVIADRLDNDGFFSSLFDITFTRFVTRKLAGPVYIVGLTLIALGFVLAFISSIGAAIATGSFWGVLLFLLDLLLSVVGAMLSVLLLRVGIEVFVAVVAIAENTRPRGRREPR